MSTTAELLRWLVCLIVGHVRTDWTRAEWVYVDITGQESEPRFTSNMPHEIRFCLRCSTGYQSRFVR